MTTLAQAFAIELLTCYAPAMSKTDFFRLYRWLGANLCPLNPVLPLPSGHSSGLFAKAQPGRASGLRYILFCALLCFSSAMLYAQYPESFADCWGGGYPEVYALAVQADGKVLAGGNFFRMGGQTRNRIAQVNPDGTLDTSFNPGVTGGHFYDTAVVCLAVQTDGRILVGGSFTNLAGEARTNIARLNPDGTLDLGFNPGANGAVVSILVQADGKLLVGGGFTTLGGQPRNYIGRLNADGTLDEGFDPTASSNVHSLATQLDGRILVGGSFTNLAGQPRNRIARLNADGTLDGGFDPGASGSVLCLAVQADGRILVGGSFTNLAGQTRNRIARLNADGTMDASFDPGASGSVFSLALQADGKILLGGSSYRVSGQPNSYIARLKADGTLDPAFVPMQMTAERFYPYVYGVALQADGKILIGGDFVLIRDLLRVSIARLLNPGLATQSLSYDGSAITWLRGGKSPEVWRTSFDFSTNGLDWTSLGAGTRIPGGWQLTGVTVPPGGGRIRARGHVAGGRYNGSAWFVEATTSALAPIRLNVIRDGATVLLRWTGGQGPYQIQATTNLGNSNSWENLGETTQTNSIALPLGTDNLFLRIRGQ